VAKKTAFQLVPDRRGMLWDLLLYVPTVTVLALIALKLWYGPNQTWSYLLLFLASFFCIAGANRILSSRMMLLPSSPVVLDASTQRVRVTLRNGEIIELAKNVRFFSDYAGKSFGLSGMDLSGKRRQYVFHRGQFGDEGEFRDLTSRLRVFK